MSIPKITLIIQANAIYGILVSMKGELIGYINDELKKRSWSMRKLGDASGVTGSSISQVLSGNQKPTYEFCVKIAYGLGETSPKRILILADLWPDEPPPLLEEEQFLELLRRLPQPQRDAAFSMIKGLYSETQDTPRTDTPPNNTPNAAIRAPCPAACDDNARQIIREEIDRREREREHTIATLLSGLEAAGVDMAEVRREAEHMLLLRYAGKELREEDDLFT